MELDHGMPTATLHAPHGASWKVLCYLMILERNQARVRMLKRAKTIGLVAAVLEESFLSAERAGLVSRVEVTNAYIKSGAPAAWSTKTAAEALRDCIDAGATRYGDCPACLMGQDLAKGEGTHREATHQHPMPLVSDEMLREMERRIDPYFGIPCSQLPPHNQD